ncbi:MAG: hypothetical protein RLZZ299_527 [Pseudomonadota bacterium]|jgi:hypothetical protein
MVALALLLACGGGAAVFRGTQLADYMPLDPLLRAFYTSDDYANADGYDLVVTRMEPTEITGGFEIVTLEYALTKDDGPEILATVQWSSDSSGIRIHGYGAGSEPATRYATPVLVARQYMQRGESLTTDTDGLSITSTFVDFQACPVPFGVDFDECAHINIDDGDGDPNAGPFYVGEYWLVPRYGVAWMKNTGAAVPWELTDYEQRTEDE